MPAENECLIVYNVIFQVNLISIYEFQSNYSLQLMYNIKIRLLEGIRKIESFKNRKINNFSLGKE